MSNQKIIVTCAITGGIHTPTLSPHLPYTPDQIAEQAIDAANAGAAILHLHARDPENGRPTGDPQVFGKFLPRIKEATDAVINLTTGGSPEMTPEDRLAAALKFSPEMCSLNMGSINFSFHPLAGKIKEWKFDWEKDYIATSDAFIFRNTFRDIERTLELMRDHGTRYEHECYDVGHLYNLAFLVDKGLLKPPFFIQSVFGFLGGLAAHPKHVQHFRDTPDMLFGDDYYWSVLAAGKEQIRMTTLSAVMGGNVRVGMEDSLWYGKGQLAKSSAEQVGRIRRILDELGLEVATPDEARAILGTKGADKVNF